MTKSENSTTTRSSSKISSKTTKTINTSSAINGTLVEVEPPNIQANTINKFHIQNFKITNENFHKWYSDLKLFLDSEELEYNNEAKLQNKPGLSEETKVIYSLDELNKVGIAYSFTFLYVEKTFKDLKRRHNKTKYHN
ncbi:hypothetical protein LY90DRAFT_504450 [Neocallimastix californiae]|uniref:Uncharacterized protein n=1 Tax=Neocallimastix californiae TaxID=1754190 RepID=A0A1Y2E9J9_9FUNG|nr:hypothetical protein LY90DRAFT_504450 [Neocallimastix californiae]|eukprot:ORY67974.1 hypothetical protein LY90DRAFT_504450 [Neocallimastix californiae]